MDKSFTLDDCEVNGSIDVCCRYEAVQRSLKSSLVIVVGSFLSNLRYQLMVELTNKVDPSRQERGFLLLRIEETSSPLIVIRSSTSSSLIPNSEYQSINPTSELSLVSRCAKNCSSTPKAKIIWNIYQGKKNLIQWILGNRTDPLNFFGQSFILLFVFTSSIEERIRLISPLINNCSCRILRSNCGDSKLFIRFHRREVQVR